jgi:hypothetical protein
MSVAQTAVRERLELITIGRSWGLLCLFSSGDVIRYPRISKKQIIDFWFSSPRDFGFLCNFHTKKRDFSSE